LLQVLSCCWFVVAQTFAAAIALPTSVAVLMLLIWHIRMIHENKTTIEHAEVSECLMSCSARWHWLTLLVAYALQLVLQAGHTSAVCDR
jgi:Na+/citrate or Na+/malate symporter